MNESDFLIDLDHIISIESNWKEKAYNKKSGARGLGQITQIALQDYNQMNPGNKKKVEDLYDPQTNMMISSWMLNERIPSLLRHYKKPVTEDNILWAYNAGIGRVVDNVMPLETKDYIRKYKARKTAVSNGE